ncbi:MAG: zinc-ribbon domain-containing protein [Candidatus Heimdallarchaeota archaeon]|nr:zinc-ribbon domain-containing protein [Candidatus Heimdallarchaeota archaeon]MCK4253169.1 zinc-ribbon domain-containing protein [Candidatus Heimdallarchaeota archaeon]
MVVSSKEIKCPFCDADNPPDSLFCIKCGASLKPAK